MTMISPIEIENYISAQRHAQPTGLSLPLCAEIFAQAHARLGGRSLLRAVEFFLEFHPDHTAPKTLPELVDDFATGRETMGVHPEHVANIRRQLGRLAAAFPEKTIGQLRTAGLDRWIASYPWQPATRNDVRKICITFGNWARARRYLPIGHPTEFEGMLRYKIPATKIAIYTPTDLKRILIAVRKSRPHLLPWVACAALTGARASELSLLRWEHIDFERGFVTVASQKVRTKARRLVPLQPKLRQFLHLYRRALGLITDYADPRAAVSRICSQAGVALCRNGFRHSYISYRVARTADPARVALECGNSPEVIFHSYRELVTPTEARAWFRSRARRRSG